MLPAVVAPVPSRTEQSSWMLTSGIVRAAFAFGSNLILVRAIAPEQFGEFALALAAIGMFETVISLRVGVQVLRLRDDEFTTERRRLYWSVLIYEVIAAGLLSAGWLAWLGTLSLWTGILIVGLLVQHWVTHTISFYERQQPYRRLATLEGGAALVAHSLAAVLALLGAGAAALYLRELALGLFLVGALALAGGLRPERPRWLGLDDWHSVLRDVRGIWFEGVLEGAFQRVTVLLVGAVGSPAATGFFYQARRLTYVPQQLLAPVTGRMTLNWLSRDTDPAAQRRLLRKMLVLLALPLLALALLCLALADTIVPILFGESWRPAAQLLRWMVGVIVFYSLFGVVKTYLIAMRQLRLLLVARVLQWAGLLLPLAPALWGDPVGVEHVALGLSLSNAVVFVASFAFAKWQPATG